MSKPFDNLSPFDQDRLQQQIINKLNQAQRIVQQNYAKKHGHQPDLTDRRQAQEFVAELITASADVAADNRWVRMTRIPLFGWYRPEFRMQNQELGATDITNWQTISVLQTAIAESMAELLRGILRRTEAEQREALRKKEVEISGLKRQLEQAQEEAKTREALLSDEFNRRLKELEEVKMKQQAANYQLAASAAENQNRLTRKEQELNRVLQVMSERYKKNNNLRPKKQHSGFVVVRQERSRHQISPKALPKKIQFEELEDGGIRINRCSPGDPIVTVNSYTLEGPLPTDIILSDTVDRVIIAGLYRDLRLREIGINGSPANVKTMTEIFKESIKMRTDDLAVTPIFNLRIVADTKNKATRVTFSTPFLINWKLFPVGIELNQNGRSGS